MNLCIIFALFYRILRDFLVVVYLCKKTALHIITGGGHIENFKPELENGNFQKDLLKIKFFYLN